MWFPKVESDLKIYGISVRNGKADVVGSVGQAPPPMKSSDSRLLWSMILKHHSFFDTQLFCPTHWLSDSLNHTLSGDLHKKRSLGKNTLKGKDIFKLTCFCLYNNSNMYMSQLKEQICFLVWVRTISNMNNISLSMNCKPFKITLEL